MENKKVLNNWEEKMWPISQSTNEWLNFINEFRAYEAKISLKEKEDALLDIYSEWLKSHDDSLRSKIIKLVEEIKQICPELNFDELLKNLKKIKI